MRKPSLNKLHAAFGLSLVAAGSLAWAVISSGDELARLRAENESARRRVDELAARAHQRAVLGRRLGELEPLVASQVKTLTENVTEEKLLKRISDFTNETQLVVDEVALPGRKLAPARTCLEEVGVTLRLEGDYVSLMKFFALVEQDSHVLTVAAFSIRPVGRHVSPGERGRVSANVEVIAHRLAKGA